MMDSRWERNVVRTHQVRTHQVRTHQVRTHQVRTHEARIDDTSSQWELDGFERSNFSAMDMDSNDGHGLEDSGCER
jgi:hypothetical protein